MPVESDTGNRLPLPSELALDGTQQVSLCEVLDRVLNKGAVLVGEATISVADIDLIYLGLQVVLTSMETAAPRLPPRAGGIGRRHGHWKGEGKWTQPELARVESEALEDFARAMKVDTSLGPRPSGGQRRHEPAG